MKFELVNLTPHDLNVYSKGKVHKTYPSSGNVARVATKSVKVGEIDGIPVYEQTYGKIEGLPKPQKGVFYIGSLIVREAAKQQGRKDVISPDTSPEGAVRDNEGRIIGTRGFVR